MTNIEKFEKLSVEIQDQLLEIESLNSLRDIKLISEDQFILKEDIGDNLSLVEDDEILDAAIEICSCSSTNSNKVFGSIQSDIKLDHVEIYSLIEDNLNEKEKKELLANFNFSVGNMKITSIDDEWKIDILEQLFNKYNSYQLEEKVKDLL